MKNIITICILTIFLATSVSAFGITSFYYEGHPLILNPGDTKDIQLLLQNEKDSQPVTIQAKLSSDIAEITGRTQWDLKSGEIDVPINVKVTIPETAQIGEEYSVSLAFTTVAEPGSKMLEFGTEIGKSIPIVIGEVIQKEEPKKSLIDIIPLNTLMGIGILIVLAALVIFLYKKKKK